MNYLNDDRISWKFIGGSVNKNKVQFVNEDDFFIIDRTKSLDIKLLGVLKNKRFDWNADCVLSFSDKSRLDYKGFTWKNQKVFARISDFKLTDTEKSDSVVAL